MTTAHLFCLCIGAVTATTSCAPKRVTVNGQEMSYEEGADLVYRQGEQAQLEGDGTTAKARYREVLDLFEGSKREPDALSRLGLLLYQERGCGPARVYLEQLSREHSGRAEGRVADILTECGGVPGTPIAPGRQPKDEGGRYAELEQRFSSANTVQQKITVASEATDIALQADDDLGAMRWLLRVRKLESDPAKQSAVDDEVRELIDARLSFRSVRVLLEELPSGEFPHGLLSYKLGRIQMHVGDFTNARTTLTKVVDDIPEHAEAARKLLARLDNVASVRAGTLGVLLPLSGRHRAYGDLALQAIRLALGLPDGKNSNGRVELVIKDTKSDAVAAAAAAEALVLEHHVQAILGPIFSYAAVPASLAAQELGVPILTISTAEELAGAGHFVFRNAVTNQDQMAALVEHAMTVKGMKTFAILHPRHPYGEELLHLFWDEVEKRKGEIRGVESYAVGDTTFTWQVKRLVARDVVELRADFRRGKRECEQQPDTYRKARCKEKLVKNIKPIVDFDGLFIPDYPATLSMVTAALAFEDIIVEQSPNRLAQIRRTLGRKVKPVTLLGASGWNSPDLPKKADRNVENAVFPDGFFIGSEDPTSAKFVAAYEKRFSRAPRLYPEALMYDSARLLGQLMAEGVTTRDGLRDRLRAVRNFAGVTGATSFANSNSASRRLKILSINNGKIIEVPPPSE